MLKLGLENLFAGIGYLIEPLEWEILGLAQYKILKTVRSQEMR